MSWQWNALNWCGLADVCVVDKQSYSRDFLDLNVGGGYCLFDAREHQALFHAILYLVALDFNLRRGFNDDMGCLYHSAEAFRLINEQIRKGIYEDATVAAVALVAAKEVCHCSPIHHS